MKGVSDMTVALVGLGACGTGFDSASHLARLLSIPLTDETLPPGPSENNLDAWAAASARAALSAAQKMRPADSERIGLLYLSFWGSVNQTVGYLESMLDKDGWYASPRLFTRSVYSAVASQTVIDLAIHGGCETLSFANLPVYRTLQRAWMLLETRRLDTVIAMWADQVEAPVQHLCQRAATELHRLELARYLRPGGGSVVMAFTRPDAMAEGIHLTLDPNIDRFGKERMAVSQGVLTSIPAYPTDGALHLASAILLGEAHRECRTWNEIDWPYRATIRLRAAKND